MKHNIFFIDDEKLILYLRKYGRGINSKDYEFEISLYAKDFWEKKLKTKLMIVFEQNNKMHKYPNRFTPTVEQLRDILLTYNEENTPVDFALAPVSSQDSFEGFAYPFQLKKYVSTESDNNTVFAKYISEKANKYRASEVCLIIVPQLHGNENNGKGFNISELQKMLTIDEKSVRAVYVFQKREETPNFIQLWVSNEALAESQ